VEVIPNEGIQRGVSAEMGERQRECAIFGTIDYLRKRSLPHLIIDEI